jgi:hypothetical protein
MDFYFVASYSFKMSSAQERGDDCAAYSFKMSSAKERVDDCAVIH